MTPEISLALTINPEIERHQPTVVIIKISTNIATVLSPEIDTIEIVQFHVNPTFVTIVILALALHFHNTIAQEMTPIPTVNRLRHISPIVINLAPHLFTDTILELLIVVVQTSIAIERPLKIVNPTPETTIIAIVTMSPCSQIFPSRHQFSPKTSMSATDVPSSKFKSETGMVPYSSIQDQQPPLFPLHSFLKLEQLPSLVSTMKPNQSSAPSNLMPLHTSPSRFSEMSS